VNDGTCLVVMYHYVRDSDATSFPAIRALEPARFERQLDWLESEHVVIALADLEAALDGGRALPPRAALLTFDDGFVDHYEVVFPVLRRRGLGGVFFLSDAAWQPVPRLLGVHCTHFLLARLGAEAFGREVRAECNGTGSPSGARAAVLGADRWDDDLEIKHLLNYELPFDEADRVLDALFTRHIGDRSSFARRLYLNEAMVREMRRGGMTFGYHTRTHRMLSRLDPVEQARELGPGVSWIRDLTAQPSVPFCYPWGGPRTYTADTVRLLEKAGYSLAFNTVRRRLALGVDGRFELPRFDTRDLPPYTDGEADAMAGVSEEA
jgi:peptidoglycan/xylan/chitin deacetylase (PgdA/CDA1 family)